MLCQTMPSAEKDAQDMDNLINTIFHPNNRKRKSSPHIDKAPGAVWSPANGAGNVDMGGGMGFNPAAMMAGMAMGGAMGQNIAGVMNNAMSGVNQPVQPGVVPPPITTVAYHVAVNGQAAGPYDLEL